MKKNAIVIASILFVAGCATGADYSTARTERSYAPSSDIALGRNTEMVTRTPQGEMIAPSDPSLSAQYDPAMGGSGSSVSGYGSSHNNTSVSDFHADSSVAGGSNEARGWTGKSLPSEGMAHPMNPAVQADSSIRGGSMNARQSEYYRQGEVEPASHQSDHIKADSSIRGGSNEARQPHSSFHGSLDDKSGTQTANGTLYDYVIVTPLESESAIDSSDSDKGGTGLLGSANWNPSDDMLPDDTEDRSIGASSRSDLDSSVGGPAASESGSASSSGDIQARSRDIPATPDTRDSLSSPGSKKDFNNDASLGGAATSQSGSSSSTSPADDIDAAHGNLSGTPDRSNASSSQGSHKDLNASSQLNQNISGEYNLNDQIDTRISDATSPGASATVSTGSSAREQVADSLESSANAERSHASVSNSTSAQESESSTSVGGPASTETGSASSEKSIDSSTPVLPPDSADPGQAGYSLFQNNRAQGVGSAAAGELGSSSLFSKSSQSSDQDLAERVKATLTRDTSGTTGINQREVARNVQVSAQNGTIVLKGTVPTPQAKDLLEIRAREMDGVHRVDNQLSVTPSADPTVRDLNRGHNLEELSDELHSLDQFKD